MSYTDVINVSSFGQWIVKDEKNQFYWANTNGIIKTANETDALNYIVAFALFDLNANIAVIRDKLYESTKNQT